MGRRRRDDRGQATTEYAGAIFVVVLLVTAAAVVAVPAADMLAFKICQAVGASCGSRPPTDRAAALSIPCVTSRNDRTLGYNVNIELLRLDRKDGDQLTVNADGSASVAITQGGGVGVEAAKEFGKIKSTTPNASIKATGNGDLTYVYNLPKEYGGEQAARELLNGHRDGLGQAVDIVVPGAETAREAATRAGHGIRDAWRWGVEHVTGDHPSQAEIDARNRADAIGTADAVQVALSLQAEGKVGASNELIKVNGSVAVEGKGTASIPLTTTGPDKASSTFAGQIKYDLKGDATLKLHTHVPPILNVVGVFGQSVGYTVTFDGKGNPTKLVLTTEETTKFQGGLAPEIKIGKNKVKIGGKGKDESGHLTMDTLTLDLTDPQNRAAYDQVFATQTASVAGHTAGVAVPRVDHPTTFLDDWSTLGQRLTDDAYLVQYDYTLSGDALSATAGKDAYKAGGWGVGGEKTDSGRRLASATAWDGRTGLGPVPLATCR